MKFSHTVETLASPKTIWSMWTAVDQWPLWDSELKAAQLYDEFCLGAVGRLVPTKGPASKFQISALDWGKSYTFTTRLPLCKLHVRRSLHSRPGNEQIAFTHEVSFEGLLAFLFSWLLGKRFRAVLPEVMRSLKQMAEQTTQTQ